MSTSRLRNRGLAAIIAVAMMGALAACGSSSGKSSGGSGGSSSAVANTSPLRFGLISGNGPGTPGADNSTVPAEKAAIAAINAAGGVNGRQLEMEFCDTQGDANKAGACATKLAGDDSILATIGNINYSGTGQINPILQNAGIPAIATHFIAIGDMGVSNIYPIYAGVLAGLDGGHLLLSEAGAKRQITVTLQSPEVAPNLDFVRKSILPRYPGTELLDPQLLAPTTTDLTAMGAATLGQKPDGIFVGLGANTVPFIQLLRSQGYNGVIAVTASSMTPAQITALGSAAGNLVMAAGLSHSGAGYDQFKAEVTKYQPSALSTVADDGVNAWIGVHMFADLLSKVKGDITRKTVTDALNAVTAYNTKGLTPNVNFSKPNPVQGFSRQFNPYVLERKAVNGVAVDVQPITFTNLFTGAQVSGTS